MVGKVAYLFAGQGSQYPGMGKDLYETNACSRAIFDKADKVLGFSLSRLCFEGTAEGLKQTIISQPAILTVTMAAYEAAKIRIRMPPAFMAGLSLGEYSALIASGALTFEDGLKLVHRRAEIMEEATHRHPGTMAAVLDIPLDKLNEICRESGAEIANINAPGQIVISGKTEAIEKASEMCVAAGAKRVIALEVSGAFHSSLMSEASVELKRAIDDTPMTAAAIPVIGNYTAALEIEPAQIRENLVYQLYKSVRWVESMQYILSQGVTKFYEFGPGKVLKGLMRRIEPSVEVINIEKKEDIEKL